MKGLLNMPDAHLQTWQHLKAMLGCHRRGWWLRTRGSKQRCSARRPGFGQRWSTCRRSTARSSTSRCAHVPPSGCTHAEMQRMRECSANGAGNTGLVSLKVHPVRRMAVCHARRLCQYSPRLTGLSEAVATLYSDKVQNGTVL